MKRVFPSFAFANASTPDFTFTNLNGFNNNSLQITGLNTGMPGIRIINRTTGTQINEKIIAAAR